MSKLYATIKNANDKNEENIDIMPICLILLEDEWDEPREVI